MNTTAQKTTQSARDLAIKMAKQMASEPTEILSRAKAQITGSEVPFNPETSPVQTQDDADKLKEHQEELQNKIKTVRTLEALNREINDIRKQELFKSLQSKISMGENIPINDFPELSMEQKQVLKAQMEAVTYQKQQQAYMESQGGGLFTSSKPSRRMGAGQRGQKAEAEKAQTRVEKPVPPSG